MEKVADRIQQMLQEKFACYQQLRLVLEAEKKAIGAIDLGTIWDTTRSKKELAGKIEEIRSQLRSTCQDSFSGMKIGSEPFSLASLVNELPLSGKTKAGLRRIKRAIDEEKDQVAHLAKFNQIQVRKYLSVVDDIMSMIGSNAGQSRYTGRGMVTQERKNNCLFRAEV